MCESKMLCHLIETFPVVAVSQPDDSLVKRLMIVISSHRSPQGMIKYSPCVRPTWNVWVTVSSISSIHCWQHPCLYSHQGRRCMMIESPCLLRILFKSNALFRRSILYAVGKGERCRNFAVSHLQIEHFHFICPHMHLLYYHSYFPKAWLLFSSRLFNVHTWFPEFKKDPVPYQLNNS